MENNQLIRSKKTVLLIIILIVFVFIVLIIISVISPKKIPPSQSNQVGVTLPDYPLAANQVFTNQNTNRFGYLVVTSGIDNTQVTIDSEEIASQGQYAPVNTPPFIVKNIPIGKHILKASKEGYLLKNYEFKISENSITALHILLNEDPEATNLKKAQALMPINTVDYSIQYFPGAFKTMVIISRAPYDLNKQLAIQWFKDRGVSNPERSGVVFVDATKGIPQIQIKP